MNRGNMQKQIEDPNPKLGDLISPREQKSSIRAKSAAAPSVAMKKGGMYRNKADGRAQRGKTKGKYC